MDESIDSEWGIDRRTVLKGAAVGTGLAGMPGLAAAGGPGGGGGPCHKDFACEDGTYVKFEFVIETDEDGNITDCYFEEETDTGLIEITDWESKDEECEPISVEWESASENPTYVATEGLAFGGNDCDNIDDPEGGSYTSGLENEGGNTAAISNLQFCVDERLELPADSYIGYEDRPESGDFDYNDFGMRASISETYTDGTLDSAAMSFTSRFHRAGDSHEIHLERTFDGSVGWTLEVTRDNAASGNEVTAGSHSGTGTLDVVLFDTDNFVQGDTVTLELTITSGSVAPPTSSPRPDVAANNPLFEVYDPYMDNTSQGTIIDLSTVQENVDMSEADWDGPSDVPNIIVVPDVDFVPPAEGVTITADYPDFDNYYQNVDDDGDVDPDPAFDDWFNP